MGFINYFIMSHLTSKYNSTPTYTFKARNSTITSSNKQQNLPSPFHYQPETLLLNQFAKNLGKFSQSQRHIGTLQKKNQLPGPGTYQQPNDFMISKSFNKGQALKKGQARFFQNNSPTPAPNLYRPTDIKSKTLPKYSFTKTNRSIEETEQLPSPDAYNPNLTTHQRPLYFSIGSSKRKDNVLPSKSPGPGSYLQEKSFSSNTSFNVKKSILPKEKRASQSLQHLPAPNSYKHQSFFQINKKKERGFTLNRRYSTKQLGTPAPNLYNNQYHQNNIKVAFPKAERKYLSAQIKKAISMPGPGSHELQPLVPLKSSESQNNKKLSFSHSKSKAEQKKQHKISFINPEKLNFTLRTVPKYTIPLSKVREQARKPTVHVFYDSQINNISKSKSGNKIPNSLRMQSNQKSNVGPGYYNTEIVTTSNKMKFPKSTRKTFLDEAVEQKLKTFKDISHQSREQFPNPPKYMNVYKKLAINNTKIKQY